jgi:YidC/Oxa1 family membrane protein insertase
VDKFRAVQESVDERHRQRAAERKRDRRLGSLAATLLRDRLDSGQGENNVVQTRKDSQGNYIIGYTGPALTVAPGAKAETSAILYAGPKSQAVLKELSPGLELTVDYGILWFIAQPIFWLLQHIHSHCG